MLFILTSLPFLGVVAFIVTGFFINWTYRSLKMDKNYSDLYVLITGCDTGFGNRCALKLDELGFHVFATCLTAEKVVELSEICSKNFVAIRMDVTDDSSVQEALRKVKEHLPEGRGLWAVINNAGIVGSTGACEWLQKADYELTIRVNFLGMVSVTNAFLPLVRKARGRIVNMASVLGRVSVPPASYSVSKFCVEAYSDCLRREMAVMGVSVHTIEPGGYQTNVTNADLHINSINKKFSELSDEIKTFYGESFKNKCVVHKEFVPHEQMVNAAFYMEVLKKLKKRVARVCLEIANALVLHQNNAPSHALLLVREFLVKQATATLCHPPYSLDLLRLTSFCFPCSNQA